MSDATNYDPLEEIDDPELGIETITNDAVAGEPVFDTGHYGGAEGSEPLEAEPVYADNELEDDEIELEDDEEE